MIGDVAPRNLQRVGRQIGGVDPCIGECARGEDRQTPRAGAQVEHARHLGRIAQLQAVAEMIVEKFADERAWNDRPLVHIERQPAHVDLVEQIGRRLSRRDALLDQRAYPCPVGIGDAPSGRILDLVRMDAECFADDERCFRDRIGGAVGEYDPRLRQAVGRETNVVENRRKLLLRGGRFCGFLSRRRLRSLVRLPGLCACTGAGGSALHLPRFLPSWLGFLPGLLRHQDFVHRAAA